MTKPPFDYEFTTDGCSGSGMCILRFIWRIRYKLGYAATPLPPWEKACEAHDHKYHPGGTYVDRVNADIGLMKDVLELGYPRLAVLMFVGVRIGGGPYVPRGWRWGYAYKYWRLLGYDRE